MGHRCCTKQKVKRGLWSPEEDEKLMNYITIHGGQHGSWSSVPKLAGLERCGKSCRLRWTNYLRPELKRGSFSSEEEEIIIDIHRILGNRWAQIAKHLPGRTDNEVKNFWNSCIKKKLISQGLDPATHNLIKNNNININIINKVQSPPPPPPQNLYFQQFPNNNVMIQNSDSSQAFVTLPPHDPMVMTMPKYDDACQNPNHVNDDDDDGENIGADGSSISSSYSVPFMGDDDMSAWGSGAHHHHHGSSPSPSSVPLYDDHIMQEEQKMDGSFDDDMLMMMMMMGCGFDHHEQLMDQTFISMDDVIASNKWNF